MPLTEADIELIRCLVCRVPVAFTPARDGLQCPTCRRVYPIKDDLPQMLLDEAYIPKEQA